MKKAKQTRKHPHHAHMRHAMRTDAPLYLVRRSKIHLVDLAGSERVYKTNVNGQVRNVCMHAGMR